MPKNECRNDRDCSAPAVCENSVCGAGTSPHVSIIALGSATLSATEQTTMYWQSDKSGDYYVYVAKVGGGEVTVLSRGQVVANTPVPTLVDGRALALGVNHLALIVRYGAAALGQATVDVTVRDGADTSGGSSGSTAGGATAGASGGSSDGSSGGSTDGATGGSGASSCADGPLPPRLFFSNITSGPNSGGDNGNGAYVTLYGLGFSSTAGTVTLGGAATVVTEWGITTGVPRGLEAIVIQLGSTVTSSSAPQPLMVTTAAGLHSNSLDFTVHATGTLYFVDANAATSGNGLAMSAAGSNAPFNKLTAAKAAAVPGDVIYLKNTFSTPDPDGADCNDQPVLCLSTPSSADGLVTASESYPIAYLGYPGGNATISNAGNHCTSTSSTNACNGVVIHNSNIVVGEVTISGIKGLPQSFEAAGLAVFGDGARLVGNAYGNSGSWWPIAVLSGSSSQPLSNTVILGNLLKVTAAGSSGLEVGSAGGVPVDTIEIAYNEIDQSDSGIALEDLGEASDAVKHASIHHNLIQSALSAITMSSGNVDAGFYDIQIHDNVMSDSGNCLIMNVAACESGVSADCVTHVWNNTCGTNLADMGAPSGAELLDAESLGGVWLDFSNNLFFFAGSDFTGEVFLGGGAFPAKTQFDHNFYGSSNGALAPPAADAAAASGDPAFARPDLDQYNLTFLSPAIDIGSIQASPTDFRGVPRPQGNAFDIGAYEYCVGLDP